MNLDNPNYEICLCRRITVKEIEKIIEENSILTLKELCEKAQVGDKCGGCREELDMLLNKVLKDRNPQETNG